MKTLIMLVSILAVLTFSKPSCAGVSLVAWPDGEGGYVVDGNGAEGVRNLVVTIGYDLTSLNNPRVETLGGTLALASDVPGVLRLRMARDQSDASFKLYLQFDKAAGAPGGIEYLTAVSAEPEGVDVPPALH